MRKFCIYIVQNTATEYINLFTSNIVQGLLLRECQQQIQWMYRGV